MQNPTQEIEGVLIKLLSTQSPDEQKKAMSRHFTEDAEFRSPLYNVVPGQQSREDALGIYQWLRVLSPNTDFIANVVTFDEKNLIVIVRGKMLFLPRLSPIPPQPAKVTIVMDLKKEGDEYLIKSQEYFYQPTELINHVFPPIAPLVRFGFSALTYISAVGAKFAQVVGIWRVSDDSSSNGNDNSKESKYQRFRSAPRTNGAREGSADSRASEDTRVGGSESFSGSEKQGGRMKVKKNRKRRDVSGQRHNASPANS
ncbi:hypothetical protein H0H87_008517 [Tephrocybe sp. NHM501043]|nr:hypothetical protein H0H87_008517 [Tephrocybe sp. NHM501043]